MTNMEMRVFIQENWSLWIEYGINPYTNTGLKIVLDVMLMMTAANTWLRNASEQTNY